MWFIVSIVDGITQFQNALRLQNGYISELIHIPAMGNGTAPFIRKREKSNTDNPDISTCISWHNHIDSEEQLCH